MNKKAIFLVILVLITYITTQVAFFNYYQIYGIPFGMSDVDNYMSAIRYGLEPVSNILSYIGVKDADADLLDPINHPLIYYIGISTPWPDIVFTFLIPFVSCCMVPLAVFIFGFYMSKDMDVGVLSAIFMILGTHSFQLYAILALWAQMFHTVGMLFGIIFFIEYEKTKKRSLLFASVLILFFLVITHPKLLLILFILGVSRSIAVNDRAGFILCMCLLLSGIFYYGNQSDYPIKLGVDYVFFVLANPMLWFLAGLAMIVILFYMLFVNFKSDDTGIFNTNHLSLIFAVVFTLAISPLYALWRPVISILPFVAYFAALHIQKFFMLKRYRNAFIFIVVLILLCWFIYETKDQLAQMLWEMMPNGKLSTYDYRPMEYKPFAKMIFGASISYKVYGYTDQWGNNYEGPETMQFAGSNASFDG